VSIGQSQESVLDQSLRLRALVKMQIGHFLEAEDSGSSKSDLAFRVLETLIVSMELMPGSEHTVNHLCQVLSLGRSPVRDALKRLEENGLVTLQRGTGIRINTLENDDLAQLLVVRRALELVATQEAIRNGTPQQLSMLSCLGDELEEAAVAFDLKRFMHVGLIAYRNLGEATSNKFVTKPLLTAYSLSRRIYFSRIKDPAHVFEAAKLHRVRFKSIAAGELLLAQDATSNLMDFFQGFVVREQSE